MNIDVVNSQNQNVGELELRDEVFGGRINTGLIWESVVRENASERRGTHKTKTRGLVSGSGRKPWRQKGTGRARVSEIRTPLWRHGGTVFGPQPRDYDYVLPRKVERGALKAALAEKAQSGAIVVVDRLSSEDGRTAGVARMFKEIGISGPTLVVMGEADPLFTRAVRNIAGVILVPAGRMTARDVADAARILVTRDTLERVQQVLGGTR
jgi:large subunit ribosomal protein L4